MEVFQVFLDGSFLWILVGAIMSDAEKLGRWMQGINVRLHYTSKTFCWEDLAAEQRKRVIAVAKVMLKEMPSLRKAIKCLK